MVSRKPWFAVFGFVVAAVAFGSLLVTHMLTIRAELEQPRQRFAIGGGSEGLGEFPPLTGSVEALDSSAVQNAAETIVVCIMHAPPQLPGPKTRLDRLKGIQETWGDSFGERLLLVFDDGDPYLEAAAELWDVEEPYFEDYAQLDAPKTYSGGGQLLLVPREHTGDALTRLKYVVQQAAWLHDPAFLVIAEEHTFFIPENLRCFLQGSRFDPLKPWYLGHRFPADAAAGRAAPLNTAAPGFALSRRAIQILAALWSEAEHVREEDKEEEVSAALLGVEDRKTPKDTEDLLLTEVVTVKAAGAAMETATTNKGGAAADWEMEARETAAINEEIGVDLPQDGYDDSETIEKAGRIVGDHHRHRHLRATKPLVPSHRQRRRLDSRSAASPRSSAGGYESATALTPPEAAALCAAVCTQNREAPSAAVAGCLQAVGVEAVDTRDKAGGHRFNVYGPVRLSRGEVDEWYAGFHASEGPTLDGAACCASDTVSFHYVGADEARVLHQIFHSLDADKPANARALVIMLLTQAMRCVNPKSLIESFR